VGRGERSESEVSQAESNGLAALDRTLDRDETRRRRAEKENKKNKRDKKSSRDYDSDEDGDEDGSFSVRKSKARESDDDEDIDMLEKAAERAAQIEKKEKKDRKRREQEGKYIDGQRDQGILRALLLTLFVLAHIQPLPRMTQLMPMICWTTERVQARWMWMTKTSRLMAVRLFGSVFCNTTTKTTSSLDLRHLFVVGD